MNTKKAWQTLYNEIGDGKSLEDRSLITYFIDAIDAQALDRLFFNKLRSKDALILDLGCGTGRLLPMVHRKGHKAFGTDFSANSIKTAHKFIRRNGTQCHLMVSDAEYLPFKDRVFDGVICWGLLEYVNDPSRILAEVNRVTQDTSVIVLACLNRESVLFKFKKFKNKLLRVNKPDVYGYTMDEVLQAFKLDNAVIEVETHFALPGGLLRKLDSITRFIPGEGRRNKAVNYLVNRLVSFETAAILNKTALKKAFTVVLERGFKEK